MPESWIEIKITDQLDLWCPCMEGRIPLQDQLISNIKFGILPNVE